MLSQVSKTVYRSSSTTSSVRKGGTHCCSRDGLTEPQNTSVHRDSCDTSSAGRGGTHCGSASHHDLSGHLPYKWTLCKSQVRDDLAKTDLAKADETLGKNKFKVYRLYTCISKTHKRFNRTFLIRKNKTERTFSRQSSSSKPQTIQKQTSHLAAAMYVKTEWSYHVKSKF